MELYLKISYCFSQTFLAESWVCTQNTQQMQSYLSYTLYLFASKYYDFIIIVHIFIFQVL